MSHFLVDLVKLDRLDNLIRRKATGSPEELAQRMGLSRSRLFQILSFLRIEMKAPIRYNRYVCSYEYEYLPKFYLGFEHDRLNETAIDNVYGGTENNQKINDNSSDKNMGE